MKFLAVVLCFTLAEGLRFAHNPVTVDTEVLIVNRPARLTCNYVKYRTESVREIKWNFGYGGFNAQIFEYEVTTGSKTPSDFPFIKTDADSVTDSELTITMTDFRSDNVSIGCEVEVIRDNGYGKMRHMKKLGTSYIKAVQNQNHQLTIKPDPDQGRKATPGKNYALACISRGADPAPTLSFSVAGRNVSEYHFAVVENLPYVNPGEHGITVQFRNTPESLFVNDYLTVECLAHFDDFLFDKKEIALEKHVEDVYNSGYSRPTANRRYGDWNDGANGHYTQNYDNQNHAHDDRDDQKQRNYGREGRIEGYNADVVTSKILDIIDPARHVHPGIPYDFFAGYLLLVADNVNPNANNYVTILGELPYDVENVLSQNYGRVNQIGVGKARVKLDAIKVLNILGKIGYRVISGSPGDGDGYVWTLEKKNFNAHKEERAGL